MPSAAEKLHAALAREDWPKAETLLRRKLKDQAWSAPDAYNLAKVLERAGKHKQAGVWLKKAVVKDPSYVFALYELGRWEALFGTHDAALAYLEKGHDLAPSDADIITLLVNLSLRLGHWQRAAALAEGKPDLRGALYRAQCELGQLDPAAMAQRLKADPSAAMFTAMTKPARGLLPLTP